MSSIMQWMGDNSSLQARCKADGSNMHREREREIHYVHWASKAYEDESAFTSEAHLGWQ